MVNLFLAEPRGFCAGVCRAVMIVKDALNKYGAPVYVRHEIVHNRHVIQELEEQGAIFVNELDEADISRPLIFSAHGVSKEVEQEAQRRGFKVIIDATCPLVDKVHRQIRKYETENMNIVVIGKAEHPEIIGTVGQLSNTNRVRIIKSIEEVQKLDFLDNEPIGFVTQTTLSVDETQGIAEALRAKYPQLSSLKNNDICFATTNRQAAVKNIARQSDVVVVVGSKNSSNSRQLREVALGAGAKKAYLIDDVSELPWEEIDKVENIGISAGASAPEYLVAELIAALNLRYDNIKIHHIIIAKENVKFKD